jgi:predicted amidohydrolase
LTGICRELGVFAVYGLLEADGNRIFNACALVGPDGLVASYRKIHLPFLGIDRFTTPGDRPFAVHEAAGMRIGMHICYDGGFPESARVMMLQGADLVVLPTNWPPGSECMAGYAVNTRAMENNIYYAACNRVGEERGFRFIGQSKICDPSGRALAEAPHEREEILYAQIDVAKARQKKIIRVPGLHEIDRLRDRRPEMYGEIIKPRRD